MARMRPLLEAPVLVGVGAAFDFLAGRKRQAPRWMQDRGLEWAVPHHAGPAAAAPRYLRYNPAFVCGLRPPVSGGGDAARLDSRRR